MLSTKAQKLVDGARAKLEAELKANPRARGILNDATVKLLESPTVSPRSKALLVKGGVDLYLASKAKVTK